MKMIRRVLRIGLQSIDASKCPRMHLIKLVDVQSEQNWHQLKYKRDFNCVTYFDLQIRFQKSWDTVQIVNKNRMQCGSFKFQYFIQNTT